MQVEKDWGSGYENWRRHRTVNLNTTRFLLPVGWKTHCQLTPEENSNFWSTPIFLPFERRNGVLGNKNEFGESVSRVVFVGGFHSRLVGVHRHHQRDPGLVETQPGWGSKGTVRPNRPPQSRGQRPRPPEIENKETITCSLENRRRRLEHHLQSYGARTTSQPLETLDRGRGWAVPVLGSFYGHYTVDEKDRSHTAKNL